MILTKHPLTKQELDEAIARLQKRAKALMSPEDLAREKELKEKLARFKPMAFPRKRRN